MLHSDLSSNVVAFCRRLREQHFPVGPSEEADVLRGLELIGIGDPEEFRLTLRTILASTPKEQHIFDRLYDSFWRGQSGTVTFHQERPIPLSRKAPPIPALLSWQREEAVEEGPDAAGYSAMEVLTRKDFRKYTDEDVKEMTRLIRDIARLLASRVNRRYRNAQKSNLVDFRRTLRLSLRRGGEVIDLAFRRRSRKKSRIVLLCDVSGSMDSYSRFLISFVYSFQQVYSQIETFVFSTSLNRVTEILKGEDFPEALKEIFASVPDWSGGTRIGQCLQTFLDDYARGILNRDTIVMILSDGWDIGDVGLMEQTMKQIHDKSEQVIWLNPLLGNPDYEPSCLGMQAALPSVDVFLSANNLESLRDLYHHLASGGRRKKQPLIQLEIQS